MFSKPNAVSKIWLSALLSMLFLVLAGCQGVSKAGPGPGPGPVPPPTPTPDVKSLNHIIFLAQENRTLDSYFGAMRQYWAQNGFPDQAFDGLPQFNPGSSSASAPSIAGCDPTMPFPMSTKCIPDANNPVGSFHLQTMCVENPSPSWNESHVDWNYADPTGVNAAALNGFVISAANDARQIQPPFNDTEGHRSIGYYDGNDLNYYYFMASSFATSDRWFAPVMSRTSPNREYLIAATTQGYAYPPGTNSNDNQQLSAKIIFQELQDAGITWKIYINPAGTICATNPTPECLYENASYLHEFTYGQTVINDATLKQNIVPISQYFTDVQNGTLPQVAQIEPASGSGLDEHAADYDAVPACCSVQAGANYTSSLMNALMASQSWKDSAFILTYDEPGGFYDHVSPQPTVSPDGIKPVDLMAGDICTVTTGPTCDFVFTGYRLPLIVVSPFTKKNYVSHTVADTTAILKLIETRFNLPALTKRDAAQMDMTEFFDFANPPWATPPSSATTPALPAQNTGGACYLDHLP